MKRASRAKMKIAPPKGSGVSSRTAPAHVVSISEVANGVVKGYSVMSRILWRRRGLYHFLGILLWKLVDLDPVLPHMLLEIKL